MNYWIIKDTKFGYRYTTNKNTRKIILDYFNDYLFNLISTKGSRDDLFIIVGGVFSNTNPSIIAIDDAYNSLSKLSKLINVVLINTDKDIRLFDGESYSTLDLLKNIHNIKIISDTNNIDYNNFKINVNNNIIDIDGCEIVIPNAIQFEKDDNSAGIFINKQDGKYIIIPNKYSPKHKIYNISVFKDFENIIEDNNFIHLIINNELLEENRTLLNVNIFKVKPISIKYIDNKQKIEKNDDIININNNFNIINVINENIGENIKLKKQFDRIINIYRSN